MVNVCVKLQCVSQGASVLPIPQLRLRLLAALSHDGNVGDIPESVSYYSSNLLSVGLSIAFESLGRNCLFAGHVRQNEFAYLFASLETRYRIP